MIDPLSDIDKKWTNIVQKIAGKVRIFNVNIFFSAYAYDLLYLLNTAYQVSAYGLLS